MSEHINITCADRLRRIKRIAGMISREFDMPHQKALDAIAKVRGHTHWGSLAASIGLDAGAGPKDVDGTIVLSQSYDRNTIRASHRTRVFDRTSDYGLDGLAEVIARFEAGASILIAGGTSSLKDDLLIRMLLATRKKAHVGILNRFDQIHVPHDRPNWEVSGYKGRGGDEAESIAYRALRLYDDKEKEVVFVDEYDTTTAMSAIMDRQRTIATLHVPTAEEAFDRIIELATHRWSDEDRALRIDRFRKNLSARFCVIGMGQGQDDAGKGVVGTILNT